MSDVGFDFEAPEGASNCLISTCPVPGDHPDASLLPPAWEFVISSQGQHCLDKSQQQFVLKNITIF